MINIQHIKVVPRRKIDINDAEWITHLLQHSLLCASLVLPRPQSELRELTRYRSSIVAKRTRLINRLQKVLEDSSLKLTSVIANITDKSGQAILHTILQGEQKPEVPSELARGRLREKCEQLKETESRGATEAF